ncbi:MAG: F0F1 ATP synthase subunit A [Planctomycetaceae bacterium]
MSLSGTLPLAAGHSEDTFHHVRDFGYFELPGGVHLELPEIFGFQVTKFMVLQVVAGLILVFIFRGLAKRVHSSGPVIGRWWNFWETLAVFIRDEVVRPTIGEGHHHDHGVVQDGNGSAVGGHADAVGHSNGHSVIEAGEMHGGGPVLGHRADKYLPYVWTCFFYVLICNLLGAVPWLGSPTAEINVTGVIAAVTLGFVVTVGVQESGPVGFLKSLAPPMEMHIIAKVVLVPFIWLIELLGFLVKHGVLAIRLFANIMAGHTVIAVILGFIAASMHSGMFYVVMPASVLGQIAIGMLELFVAFLQAYIFAFLATLFISAAVNPH